MSFFFKKVKCQGQKVYYQQKGLITWNTHVKYQSFSTQCSKVINKISVFKKKAKLPWASSQCKKCWYLQKDLITKNSHVKY